MLDIDGWAHMYSGKVRDLYVPQNSSASMAGAVVLVVASDRISAYDHVLSPPVADKGKILNQMSAWWFNQLRNVTANHVVSYDVPDVVRGRAVVCRQLHMYPVECVARGYLTGSALGEYRETGAICGIRLPAGLREGEQLPEPIFTPAAKAPVGEHDENITFDQMCERIGFDTADELRQRTIDLYATAAQIAAGRGIIIADTKFEFGAPPEGSRAGAILADEVLTPDSSRFWPADDWRVGQSTPSFDKQYVRDWLTSEAAGWDRRAAAPPTLPGDVVAATRDRYLQAYRLLTGSMPEL